jgi:hypothetical protein
VLVQPPQLLQGPMPFQPCQQQQFVHAQQYHALHSSITTLSLSTQQHPQLPYPHLGHGYPPAHVEEPMMLSPGVALWLKVLLVEFCDKYGISKSNCEKPKEPEYVLGDKLVEKLEEAEWGGVAKFLVLGWQGFLAVHQWFFLDVKEDQWPSKSA